MYGLKGQDDESIAQDLNVISQLNPEQVTLYELRTNMIALKELPDKDALYQQYCLFYDGLIQQGYYARFGHAAPSGVMVNYGSRSTAVKNVENGEKSPERVDVVRFKLYLRHVRTCLYS